MEIINSISKNFNHASAEDIARALEGKRSTNGWQCLCPSHADSSPSLSVSTGSDGKVLYHCHAGCSQSEVTSALKARGLIGGKVALESIKRTEYVYRDEGGKPALKVTRQDQADGSKRIFQSHMENGEWRSGGAKVEVAPYMYEAWQSHPLDRWILLVEGEKCVHALIEREVYASTTPGGSKNWRPHYAKYFKGRKVAILPDNDRPGLQYAAEAYRDLLPVAKQLKVIELPGLNEGGDVVDFFAQGKTVEQLKTLILENQCLPSSFESLLKNPTPTLELLPVPNAESWPAIKDLPRALPLAPRLTPELAEQMIPAPIRPWILDISERMQVPIESVAACAFSTLSGVIGRKIALQPKKNDDWRVLANLWMALVARPSQKKTPTMSEVMKPLQVLENQEREKFKSKQAEGKAAQAARKAKMDAIKDDMKAAAKSNSQRDMDIAQRELAKLEMEDAEQSVFERRFKTSDATVEKLGELLNQNPNGLIYKRDELSGWLRSFDRPGREGVREFFLEAWNGRDSFDVDRIGRGSLHVKALCLTVLGGIQPGKLESYISEASKGLSGDDGLLQRFQLFIYPEKSDEEPRYVDQKPNAEARDAADRIFKFMHELDPASLGAVSCDDDIPALRFDAEAQSLFETWLTELERRLYRSQDMSPCYEAHLGKYRSLMPALALQFHLIDRQAGNVATNEVTLDSAKRAAMWCEFLEAHAQKVYAISIDAENHSAHALAKKIKDSKVTDGMKLRDLKRHHWSLLRDSASVDAALMVLEQHGWVRVERLQTEGAPVPVVKLNPGLMGVLNG